MGNHTVGQAIERAAIDAKKSRRPGESALDILDRICNPYRNCDAEFESTDQNNPDCVHPDCDDSRHPHPSMALGMLLLEAFAPNGVADAERYRPMLDGTGEAEEMACDAWWAEVREPFSARYNFF